MEYPSASMMGAWLPPFPPLMQPSDGEPSPFHEIAPSDERGLRRQTNDGQSISVDFADHSSQAAAVHAALREHAQHIDPASGLASSPMISNAEALMDPDSVSESSRNAISDSLEKVDKMEDVVDPVREVPLPRGIGGNQLGVNEPKVETTEMVQGVRGPIFGGFQHFPAGEESCSGPMLLLEAAASLGGVSSGNTEKGTGPMDGLRPSPGHAATAAAEFGVAESFWRTHAEYGFQLMQRKTLNGKKEGLEESTQRIIQLLQIRGRMLFKDIHEQLNINYRRVYDILNVLLTTPLVQKVGKKRGHKLPFTYLDGTPLPEPVDIRNVLAIVESEEETAATIEKRVHRLEEELKKDDPIDPRKLYSAKEIDSVLASHGCAFIG